MSQPLPSPSLPVFRAYAAAHGVAAPLDDLSDGQTFHATRVAFESVEKFHLGVADLLLKSVGSRIHGSAPSADGFVRVASLGHGGTQVQPLDLRLVRGDVLRASFVNLSRGCKPKVSHVLHVTGHMYDPAPPPPTVLPLALPPSTAEPAWPAAAPPRDEDDDLKLDEEQEEAFAEARVAAAAGKIV